MSGLQELSHLEDISETKDEWPGRSVHSSHAGSYPSVDGAAILRFWSVCVWAAICNLS
jgi:hypothetical protein